MLSQRLVMALLALMVCACGSAAPVAQRRAPSHTPTPTMSPSATPTRTPAPTPTRMYPPRTAEQMREFGPHGISRPVLWSEGLATAACPGKHVGIQESLALSEQQIAADLVYMAEKTGVLSACDGGFVSAFSSADVTYDDWNNGQIEDVGLLNVQQGQSGPPGAKHKVIFGYHEPNSPNWAVTW